VLEATVYDIDDEEIECAQQEVSSPPTYLRRRKMRCTPLSIAARDDFDCFIPSITIVGTCILNFIRIIPLSRLNTHRRSGVTVFLPSGGTVSQYQAVNPSARWVKDHGDLVVAMYSVRVEKYRAQEGA
jgi:hypothetical protein